MSVVCWPLKSYVAYLHQNASYSISRVLSLYCCRYVGSFYLLWGQLSAASPCCYKSFLKRPGLHNHRANCHWFGRFDIRLGRSWCNAIENGAVSIRAFLVQIGHQANWNILEHDHFWRVIWINSKDVTWLTYNTLTGLVRTQPKNTWQFQEESTQNG